MNEMKIGCLLRQVNAGLIQYGKEHMEELDLTPAQSMMLKHLLSQNKEEYCLKDICMEAKLSKATVSVMLKALRKKGYLQVSSDSEDDRRKRIILTQKAYEMQELIEEDLRRKTECVYRDISEKELSELEHTLNKMVLNLKQTSREG